MDAHAEGKDTTAALAVELARVAKALERQNELRRRFMTGLVFGLGTAIGASIVASFLILAFTRILHAVGLDAVLIDQRAAQVLENQLKNQAPQE